MKAIKPFVVTLALILSICSASGIDIDSVTARTVARNFYLNMLAQSRLSAKKSTSQEIELILIHMEHADLKKASIQDQQRLSNPLYYVFNVNEDDGFVIVPGDDRIHPVLAYAFTGHYPIKEHVPALERWMLNYREQIEYILREDLKAGDAINREWEKYLSSTYIKGVEEMNEVLPLLSTTWNQGCYYNELCPVDTDGVCGHAIVGCVAVAVAQVMKYWDHPVSSIKIPGYFEELNYVDDEPIEGSAYGCIPDIESTVYRWSDMPDRLDHDSQDQEVAAVSELLYHAGVACQMNYGPAGSGAYSWNAQNALISYFHYSPSLRFTCREDYSNENWKLLIQEELENNRPVYYRGQGEGAHAFVCDGYQDEGYYHFNWGWGGYGDGYFLLSGLNPGSADFNEYQCAIIGIEPGESHSDPYENMTQISGCGPDFIQTYSGGGTGAWNLTGCYRNSPGIEQVYSFIAPDTGIYGIEVISASGSVDYSWREAVCGEAGWKCVNWIESEGRHGILPWIGGTAYHLLLDDSDTIQGIHQFYINNLGRPELSYKGIEIDDDSITSKGNNNGSAEPGETIELRVTLLNSGTGDTHNVSGVLSAEDSLIIISDDYESYGDIPAGEDAKCGADYDLIIPPDYPENSKIPFELEVNSNEGSWTIHFFLHVYPHPSDPCDHIVRIEGTGPEHTVEFSGGARGAWNSGQCGPGTPGEEQVYSFTPMDTGMYSMEVVSADGPVCCAWQTADCRETGWNCLSVIDSAGSYGSLGWDVGKTYYILLDDTDTTAGVHQFFINYLGMPDLAYCSHEIDDHSNSGSGTNNGLAEPGETVYMMVTIQNTGDCNAHDVSANISVTDSAVSISSDFLEYGDIEAGGISACEASFELSISPTCQGDMDVTLYLDIQSEEERWKDQFDLYIGANRTSIGDYQHEALFTVFPNPTNGIFNVRFLRFGSYTIELESLNGRQIFGQNVVGNSYQIDLSPFPPGVYLLTVRSKSSSRTEKIIRLRK